MKHVELVFRTDAHGRDTDIALLQVWVWQTGGVMQNPLMIGGIHHITAITGSAADNLSFYNQLLGLRLIKKTVNFDDPYTYHLYYGDAVGTPGTALTFFPWEHLPQGRPGTGMVTAVAFVTARSALDFWWDRLRSFHVAVGATERFGDPVLQFKDPDGLGLELIGLDEPSTVSVWQNGPVPAAEAIRGFHSATESTGHIATSRALLVGLMKMTPEGVEGNRHRFRITDRHTPGRFYDMVMDENTPKGEMGTGSVHHIAFRTPTEEAQTGWQSLLRQNGFSVTPVRDRSYFRSIYFHEPGGVLFEIATDGPGFTIDETPERLGHALKLPPQYEPMRKTIEGRLPRLEKSV
jgi:glyoxalase family protein